MSTLFHFVKKKNKNKAQNKEGILPVATLNVTQLTVLRQRCTFSKAEVYIDVYNGDDNFATSGATSLADLDLQETYRAIDSALLVEYLLYSVNKSTDSRLMNEVFVHH